MLGKFRFLLSNVEMSSGPTGPLGAGLRKYQPLMFPSYTFDGPDSLIVHLKKLNFQFPTHLRQKKAREKLRAKEGRSSMAMRREDDVIVVDEDFLSLVEAAEATALSNKRRKIINGDESISVLSTKEEEGAYTAALRGSKSNLWQQTSLDSGNIRSKGGALKAITNNFSALAESANSDNGCFKCGKLGHWARDCDAPGGGIGGDRGKSNDSVPEKPCPCGLGSCSVLTANTEKNRGRKFYKCPVREENGGCGFFEWCDNASATPISSGVQYSSAKSSFSDLPCPCGMGSCLVLTAKTGQNIGQQFYRCPANQANSCGFFKWCIDRNIGAGYQPSNSHYANTQSSVGTGGSSSCFKCGQGGHWARDCPKPSTPSTGIGGMGSMGAMGGKSAPSGTCYKCGKSGHWAKDCEGQDLKFGKGTTRKASASYSSYC